MKNDDRVLEWFRRLGLALLALLPLSLIGYDIYYQSTTYVAGGDITSAQVNLVNLVTATGVVLGVWLVCTLLLLRRYRQPIVRLIFIHGQVLAANMVYCLAHPAPWDDIPGFLALSRVSFYFFGPLTLQLSLTFPVTLGSRRARRLSLSIIYLIAVAAMAAWLFEVPVAQQIGEFYMVLLFNAAMGVLIYAYINRATPDSRRRLRLIFFGTLLAMAPTIGLYFLPGLYGWEFHIPVWVVGILILFVPSSYMYAVTRQNLFGIDRLINRTLVYALLSVGIFAFFLAPLLYFYSKVGGNWLLQAVILAGVVMVIGWNFSWLQKQAQRLVDRLFYGGWYDYPRVVDTVSNALARSLERDQVADVLTRQLPKIMQFHNGDLYFDERPSEAEEGLEGQVVFEFNLQGGRTGWWRVAPRLDGEDFSDTDRQILNTIARQAEISLNNAVLVETLQNQLAAIRASRENLAIVQRELLRTREDERTRLARDLHDGPVQTLSGLNMQIGMVLASLKQENGKESLPLQPLEQALETMRVEVRGLLSELREVCAELRPPMLDMLGLGAAIRVFIEEWKTHHRTEVRMEIPADETLRGLPDEVSVNVYRVVQEAFSNIARHSKADNASICLSGDLKGFKIDIRDNGSGFDLAEISAQAVSCGHFGLVGMRERINLIGGSWSIFSKPGQGTNILVEWTPSRIPESRPGTQVPESIP